MIPYFMDSIVEFRKLVEIVSDNDLIITLNKVMSQYFFSKQKVHKNCKAIIVLILPEGEMAAKTAADSGANKEVFHTEISPTCKSYMKMYLEEIQILLHQLKKRRYPNHFPKRKLAR